MDATETSPIPPLFGRNAHCICCGVGILRTSQKQPICQTCVSPGEARSYCAKCGHRGTYPYEDFLRVMAKHYPDITFGTDIAVRLPACECCNQDGRPPVGDGLVSFFGIEFT